MADIGKHEIVFGASGKRAGCRVCRIGDTLANGANNPAWKEPCEPSEEALVRFEEVARERIADALSDLAHAAAIRTKGAEHDQHS